MNAYELAKVVSNYREAQRQYFKTPSKSMQQHLERMESKVDRCLSHVLNTPLEPKTGLPIAGRVEDGKVFWNSLDTDGGSGV